MMDLGGMAESRRRTCDDGHAQGSGVVWCHGGIDGRPVEGPHFDLYTRNGLAEDDGDNNRSVHATQWQHTGSSLVSC